MGQRIVRGDINWNGSSVSSTWTVLTSSTWQRPLDTVVVLVIFTMIIEAATTPVKVTFVIVEITTIASTIAMVEVTVTVVKITIAIVETTIISVKSTATTYSAIGLHIIEIHMLEWYNSLVANGATNRMLVFICAPCTLFCTPPWLWAWGSILKCECDITTIAKGFLITPYTCGIPLSTCPLDGCVLRFPIPMLFWLLWVPTTLFCVIKVVVIDDYANYGLFMKLIRYMPFCWLGSATRLTIGCGGRKFSMCPTSIASDESFIVFAIFLYKGFFQTKSDIYPSWCIGESSLELLVSSELRLLVLPSPIMCSGCWVCKVIHNFLMDFVHMSKIRGSPPDLALMSGLFHSLNAIVTSY
eukprot:Gb_32904 [translate_table: standard]